MIKTNLDDLAIFGGQPTFPGKLYVGRPNVGSRTRLFSRIEEMLDSKWLSNDGPFVAEFERRIVDYVGVKHCVVMCNATIAMEIAIRALGMQGEVIVPSFTFIATAHALQWQQITPVFCDIDANTALIDPQRIEELITSRTTGIIGVHLWGRVCDVQAIAEIAKSHKLKLLFDAAQAFGCTHKGQMVGGFGDVEVFSFHATKFFNSAEGGAAVTNNGELARKIRLMRNFGFSDFDKVTHIGTNGKMSEVCAAVGLTNFESIDEFVTVNYRNYRHYQRELDGLEGIQLMQFDETERGNYQYVIIMLDPEKTVVTRDELMKILQAENVMARRYFYPGCHRMEPYKSALPDCTFGLPQTEWLTPRVLALPTGTAVDIEEITTVCQIVRFVVTNGKQVHERMQRDGVASATPPTFASPAV